MNFKKLMIPLVALFGITAHCAHAQSCTTIDGSGGPANYSFGAIGPSGAAECVFELANPSGPAITCIRGLPSTQANLILLSKVANQVSLTPSEKSTLTTTITTIRGGFSYRTVGGQAKTTMLTSRAAFQAYINGNYNAVDNAPTLLTKNLNVAPNSVESVEIVGTSGVLDAYHASGNFGGTPVSQFHIILDAPDISSVIFLQVGTNTRQWMVCQGGPAGSLSSLTTSLLSSAGELQAGGVAARRVLIRQ